MYRTNTQDTEKKEKALYKHISFFQSNANGDLKTKHMIKKHNQMGDNKWTVPYKVDAIEHMLDDRHKPHNVSSLLELYNPASSGIVN